MVYKELKKKENNIPYSHNYNYAQSTFPYILPEKEKDVIVKEVRLKQYKVKDIETVGKLPSNLSCFYSYSSE